MAGCANDNVGKIKKGDDFCNWAEETECVPEFGANSHWEGCVDECQDIKTCGTLSPLPKDCPADSKMVSMCVCNDGFVMMDDECVPESQCGCNTEEGATIPLGSTFENCDEVCTCGNDKMYSCVSRAEGDVPEGCESIADAAANAIEDLEGIRDEFTEKSLIEPKNASKYRPKIRQNCEACHQIQKQIHVQQ